MESDSSDIGDAANRPLVATELPEPSVRCKRCSSPVLPPQKVYCTESCKVRFRNSRAKRVPAVCAACGRDFMARLQAVREGRGRLCSNACIAKHAVATGSHRGENSPRWIDGRSMPISTRYPEKTAARRTVKQALRSGSLTRQPCERCGSTVRIHAHHVDYSRPLDVRWLCSTHHSEVHRELRKAKP